MNYKYLVIAIVLVVLTTSMLSVVNSEECLIPTQISGEVFLNKGLLSNGNIKVYVDNSFDRECTIDGGRYSSVVDVKDKTKTAEIKLEVYTNNTFLKEEKLSISCGKSKELNIYITTSNTTTPNTGTSQGTTTPSNTTAGASNTGTDNTSTPSRVNASSKAENSSGTTATTASSNTTAGASNTGTDNTSTPSGVNASSKAENSSGTNIPLQPPSHSNTGITPTADQNVSNQSNNNLGRSQDNTTTNTSDGNFNFDTITLTLLLILVLLFIMAFLVIKKKRH